MNTHKIDPKNTPDTPLFCVYTNQASETIATLLNTDVQKGLTTEQVAYNKKKYGANVLPVEPIRWWNILWKQCSSLLVLIFVGLGIVSLLLGEITNALIIATCVLTNLSFGFYQEYSTTQAIALLKKYLISYVKVRRNNTTITIPSNDLVVGDILILEAGDRLFADIRIVAENNLMIDESILTGESGAVHKTATTNKTSITDIFNAQNIGFTGTTIINGSATGIIFAVGKKSTLGTIVQPTGVIQRESDIVANTNKLAIFLIKLILITLFCVIVAHFFIKGSQNYINIFIFATALAISVIPEALPIIITFCLSSGATHLAKKHVLIKRLSAIEDFGAVEILCTDKTGTLTENKVVLTGTYTVPPYQVALEAVLAADIIDTTINPAHGDTRKGFDAAIYNSLTPEGITQINDYKRIKELPYDPIRKVNSVLVQDSRSSLKLIVRGMPEDVLPLCSNNTDTSSHESLNTWLTQENSQGHRIIAVAIKVITTPLPEITDLRNHEENLILVGMLAFSDPLKPTTIEAIQKSKKLGLHIKVLSGDSVAVCFSVAQQIGLATDSNEVLTGAQFAALNPIQQIEAAANHAIFARCLPAHKLEIIQALQQNYVVAYLGDGINDIPALKMANVSLVVQEAADITRDTADIILLKKNLLIIVDGIEEGRKIVINALKYIKTTLANNFGNLYAIAVTSLFIDYLPILPIHILLINLLSDFPLLAISTDSVDPRALQMPQRFSASNLITFVLLMGFVSNIFDLITFALFHKMPAETVQMAWYMENMLTEILLIFSVRTTTVFFKAPRPSTPLIVLSIAALGMAIIPFYTTIGHTILLLPPLSARHFLWVIGIGCAYFITVEVVKHYYYTFGNNKNNVKLNK